MMIINTSIFTKYFYLLNTITEVVPSPTSSSCVLLISIIDFAAGCCTCILRVNKMCISHISTRMTYIENHYRILSYTIHRIDNAMIPLIFSYLIAYQINCHM